MTERWKGLLLAILELLFDNFDIVVRADGGELVIQFRARPIPDHLIIRDDKENEDMDPIAAGKKRVLSFVEATKNGTVIPTDVAGEPVWSVTPDGVVQLLPAPGGMTCDVANIAGVGGDVEVTVTADAKLAGGGTKSVSGSKSYTAAVDATPDHLVVSDGGETDL